MSVYLTSQHADISTYAQSKMSSIRNSKNPKCFQMSEHKKTVERSSRDTFWGFCCYSVLEELQTSSHHCWFLSAYCNAYWCVSGYFIPSYGRIWWECSIFLLSPKSAQNQIDWKQISGYISLLFGLPARYCQWCLSLILSHRSLQQAFEVLIHYSRIHTANIHVHFSLKGIMIEFSLEEEKG